MELGVLNLKHCSQRYHCELNRWACWVD